VAIISTEYQALFIFRYGRIMLRLSWLLIGSLISVAGIATRATDLACVHSHVPNRDTPQKLKAAWLSFHQTGLCQDIDAVFVFTKSGLEVWSRIESDKSYQKFRGLFESLKDSYPVELYTTRFEIEKEKDDEDDPPPSLWQNHELRSYLGDRAISPKFVVPTSEERARSAIAMPDLLIKQRLKIYAEQTLNWNRRVERYSMELTALAYVACAHDESPQVISRAIVVCVKHAQDLQKYLGKLAANLTQAIPISERKRRPSASSEIPVNAIKDSLEKAMQISVTAQSVSRRVYHFIYPENYTVEVDELRHPSLLDSIEVLRTTVAEFERSLVKPAGNKP
jgi:hypothetical protein